MSEEQNRLPEAVQLQLDGTLEAPCLADGACYAAWPC